MIHVCHKITLSYPQRRCPLAYHKGMWGREARRRLFRYVFEAVRLQRVRSLSPSEEKHWSTIWSETSSSVDGLHFGLWSLSTSTGNTQRVRIKRKKYEWTAPTMFDFCLHVLQWLTGSYALIEVAASLQNNTNNPIRKHQIWLLQELNVLKWSWRMLIISLSVVRLLVLLPCRPGSVDTPSPTRLPGSESRLPSAACRWFSGRWATSLTESGRGNTNLQLYCDVFTVITSTLQKTI